GVALTGRFGAAPTERLRVAPTAHVDVPVAVDGRVPIVTGGVVEDAILLRVVVPEIHVVLREKVPDDQQQPALDDLDVLDRVRLLAEVAELLSRRQLAHAPLRTRVDEFSPCTAPAGTFWRRRPGRAAPRPGRAAPRPGRAAPRPRQAARATSTPGV